MTDKPVIPDHHIAFCKAIAKLCREYKMDRVGLNYRPPFQDTWRDEIQMVWEQGRHGEASDKLSITSTVRVHTTLDKTT